MEEMDAFHYRISVTIWMVVTTFDGALAKGGGVRIYDPEQEQIVYPSEIQRYYYKYYIEYFTPSGFYYAATQGSSKRTVNICENYEPYFDNETVLGAFPCPMEKDPDSFTECCGDAKYQYCCRLIDTTDFRLKIGLGGALALGVIVGIIVFAIMKIRGGASKLASRSVNQRKMLAKGIPRYAETSNGNFKACQTDDGYQILVQFKRTRFYERLWKALCSHYANLAWKYREGGTVKEGKVTLGDSDWVTLMLCDDVRGSPMMVVSREKSAVDWMEGPFIDICNALDEESGGCFSCFHKSKTHPVSASDDTTHSSSQNHSTSPQKRSKHLESKKKTYQPSKQKELQVERSKGETGSTYSGKNPLPLY